MRPHSAHPSDHWAIHASPAKLAAGALQPQHMSRHQSPNPCATPQSATTRPKSAKSAKQPVRRASKPPMGTPENATEAAVMSALKKAGILERLGDASSRCANHLVVPRRAIHDCALGISPVTSYSAVKDRPCDPSTIPPECSI